MSFLRSQLGVASRYRL